jgi:hypothetical protein
MRIASPLFIKPADNEIKWVKSRLPFDVRERLLTRFFYKENGKSFEA